MHYAVLSRCLTIVCSSLSQIITKIALLNGLIFRSLSQHEYSTKPNLRQPTRREAGHRTSTVRTSVRPYTARLRFYEMPPDFHESFSDRTLLPYTSSNTVLHKIWGKGAVVEGKTRIRPISLVLLSIYYLYYSCPYIIFITVASHSNFDGI